MCEPIITAEQVLESHIKAFDPFVHSAFIKAMEQYASQQTAELQGKVEELQAKFDKCESLLAALTDLKYIKDTQGKTQFYVNQQPKVWQEVQDYIRTREQALEDKP